MGCTHPQRVIAQYHRERATAVGDGVGLAVVGEGGGLAGLELCMVDCLREERTKLLGTRSPGAGGISPPVALPG